MTWFVIGAVVVALIALYVVGRVTDRPVRQPAKPEQRMVHLPAELTENPPTAPLSEPPVLTDAVIQLVLEVHYRQMLSNRAHRQTVAKMIRAANAADQMRRL